MAISTKYKDMFDDFSDSSNTKSLDQLDSPDWLEPIDRLLHNATESRNDSSTFLDEDCFDEDVLVTSLESRPKIWASQMHQCHDVALFGLQDWRVQYKNDRRDEENEKNERGGENGIGNGDGEDYRENLIDLVIEKNCRSEVGDYYYIIYR